MLNLVYPCPSLGWGAKLQACMFLVLSLYFCPLQNPAVADIYTEHAHQVVVAKYAPSGFYIASGGNYESIPGHVCGTWGNWVGPG